MATSECKNSNGYFKFGYSEFEYKNLLKKFKGDVSKLNKELKRRLFEYINRNKNTDYAQIRKDVYISAKESELIAEFCNTKQISRSQLSELVIEETKKDILYNTK